MPIFAIYTEEEEGTTFRISPTQIIADDNQKVVQIDSDVVELAVGKWAKGQWDGDQDFFIRYVLNTEKLIEALSIYLPARHTFANYTDQWALVNGVEDELELLLNRPEFLKEVA